MLDTSISDPMAVLGLPATAGEQEVRARYLELVRQFPPEREPERFREIRAAFEVAQDPLRMALRLIEMPDPENAPVLMDVIRRHQQIPPPLTPTFLLSLGNRSLPGSIPAEKAG